MILSDTLNLPISSFRHSNWWYHKSGHAHNI